MTTIAYRAGVLVADSCITESTLKDEPRSRTYERKLKTKSFSYIKMAGKVAIASSGDAGLFTVDDLVLDQAIKVFKSKNTSGYFAQDLNVKRYLDARKKLIGKKGEYEGVLVIYHSKNALPYIVSNSGYVNRFDPDFEPDPSGPAYYASGSDSAVALGAMYAGASALEAVRAAALHGVFTGGKINTIEWIDDEIVERAL